VFLVKLKEDKSLVGFTKRLSLMLAEEEVLLSSKDSNINDE